MEKFAILSVTADQTGVPTAIFGQSPVNHLVTGLERSGIRRFLLTGDIPATDAARIVDQIKARSFGASYHRSLAELDALLPAEARLMLVAGDAWITPEIFDRLQQYDKAVLVTKGRGWERLDRDHFWAGAAMFGRRGVSAGADLPESWDIASTLLRQLTQDGARRIDVDEERDLPAPIRIDTGETARRIETTALGAGASGHWLDRLLTRPIAGALLALVRRRPQLRAPLSFVPIVGATMVAMAGFFGSIAGASAVAVTALMAERALAKLHPDRHDGDAPDWRSIATFALLAAGTMLLSRRADIALVECAILVLSAGLCAIRAPARPWNMIVPLLPVTALFLLIASFPFGAKAIGITSLFCLTTLAAERLAIARRKRTDLKPN
ncbi:hypothetical protein [Novosphingopyxis sp.]|uniref:hypothetical protein n=1 Tax=Novosphingopyxis sp. TaxID=2709690 RepID=UPI003B595B47